MKNNNQHRCILFLVLCWLHLLSAGAFAADKVLDLNPAVNKEAAKLNQTPVSLTEYFSVLEDPGLKLTLADMQRPEIARRFKGNIPPASDLHYGFTDSAYWLRLHLKNSSEQRMTRMLEISFPLLSLVQLHQPLPTGASNQQGDSGYSSISTGASKPFTTRAYRNRQFVFPIELAAHAEQIIYLRIESSNSMIIPAQMWVPEAFHEHERNDYLNQAVYFGIAMALILFNLLLFFALRDEVYLLYVVLVGCAVMVLATQTGLAHEFLWPGTSAWANISTFTAYSVAATAFIFFMRLMLNTKKVIPEYDEILKIGGIIYLFSPILFIISLSIFAKPMVILNLMSMPAIFAVGLVCAFKRQRSAYFFVAAYFLMMVGVVTTCLRTLGFLYTNIYTTNGMHIGAAVEMVLLAFAVADRFHMIRKDKAAAEINTLLARNQLAQAEKMAALGQLIASVSHEINTPIGAVKSSGKTISDALNHALMNMPKLFQSLDADSVARFLALIQGAGASAARLSSREERAITYQAADQLKAAGILNGRQKAGVLVQLKAQAKLDDYLPLLHHPESELILDTASSMATIINNTNNINTAVESVAKMILALKSFSRVDHLANKTEARLCDGLETVLTIYQGQLKQGTELVREYEDIAPLLCLPDELNQVWINLIHNALQAMNHEGTLTVGIRRVGEEAVVSVGDTGSGIPEAIRGKIFDIFFTTKPAGEGSGLGLDIVKKIIEKHQGRIDFKSEMGVGTTFFVYLPYAAK
jgi:signal transduction histidine kinase